MDADFRRTFVAKLLEVVKAGSVGLTVAACGARSGLPTAADDSGGTGGGSGGETGGTGGTGGGILLGGGGSGGSGGIVVDASLGGAAGTDAGALLCSAASGDAGAIPDGGEGNLVCAPWVPHTDAGACPNACDAIQWLGCVGLSDKVVDVVGGPYGTPDQCCYDVITESFPCYVGRTFFIDEGVVTAKLRRGLGWSERMRPDVSRIDRRTLRALGEAWARDGLFEHASVASFARFAMQLLAVGAPAELLRQTHLAAADEVNHAEMSFALAAAYLCEPVEPAELPFEAPVTIEANLAAIAHETVMEGCIGETVATLQALEALEHTTDPAVRRVLVKTVEDEARHALLAWRFMAWALEVGDAGVHVAVARAFRAFHPPAPRVEDLTGVDLARYRAHGRQTAIEARSIAERVLRDVVAPCARALLARPGPLRACA
jgi:hypothetical protein